MELRSVTDMPTGCRSNVLVDVITKTDDYIVCRDVPFGSSLVVQFGGHMDQRMMLYQATKLGCKHDQHEIFALDPKYDPLPVNIPRELDFLSSHDVLCGLGGFSSSFSFLSMSVITAVDWNCLASVSYQMNHTTSFLLADIDHHDTVYKMHQAQNAAGCQPVLAAGIPVRSRTLPAVLRAAYWLNTAGLLLECAPEAAHDFSTQAAIREYAQLRGCDIFQKVLHLHSCWPARRSRWIALIVPSSLGFSGFEDLPVLQPMPVLGELFPYDPWPVWPQKDEQQLQWTPIELQAYRCPDFGPVNRKLNLQEPCPTALHSWGSVLYACPCGCRDQGISPSSLQRQGLRGVEVTSGLWPHAPRHVHPKELQLIMGFPPFEKTLEDCRAQLVLFGNAISPIQGLWVYAHLLKHCGLSPWGMTPRELLVRYMNMLLDQRNLVWPSPTAGVATLSLTFQGTTTEVTFSTTQTVRDLVRAEALLQSAVRVQISCEGVVLPDWAFLQERSYHMELFQEPTRSEGLLVPVVLEHLGVRIFHLVPDCMACSVFLRWAGIPDFVGLVDECGSKIDPSGSLRPWQTVTVQLSPEDLDFELSLRLSGFGLDQMTGRTGSLRVSESFCGTGLWHLDQLVRSDLLLSWTGTNFASLTCWLPSFSAAVVEFWPSTMESHLLDWLTLDRALVFAITWESWGWNLVSFGFDATKLEVTFFEPENETSSVASYLAYRVKSAAKRPAYLEHYLPLCFDAGDKGSLGLVLEAVDLALGLPSFAVSALRAARTARFSRSEDDTMSFEASVSTTVPFEVHEPMQLPVPAAGRTVSRGVCHGLTVKFVMDFARALAQQGQQQITSSQIKVVLLGSQACDLSRCTFRSFEPTEAPMWIFTLVDFHWTVLHCYRDGQTLCVEHFDGLCQTSISDLTSVVQVLRSAWNTQHVQVSTQWIFPQSRLDSCGTVALAHFAYHIGSITYEQACHFEDLHDSLAICSSMLHFQGPIGFGTEEEAIIKTLEQILPSKGVPDTEVRSRAQAAIKLFGTKALQQAVQNKNVWASLKSLGNSKPKPFLWVKHHELQQHIQDRAQTKFGAVDQKKPAKKASRREPVLSRYLDPASLLLPPDLFITNCGSVLPQLQLDEVQKDARGIAFASPDAVQHFLADGKMISQEGLALLVVGQMPEHTPLSLPMHSLRVPAIYKGTNEPVILDCTSIQLGDQAVYRKTSQDAPSLTVCPTRVFRVHVFKDLWQQEHDWDEFLGHPVRSLVQAFPIFRLCKDADCDHHCSLFHPSLEEEGVESGLVDVWAFRWHGLDGSKQPQAQAEVLSVYVRVPESSFDQVHRSSGTQGVFFEPRSSDSPGPDDAFAVIWVPQIGLSDAQHRVRTLDHCVAVCRLGLKYGIRCLVKHQEELHKTLCPSRPFVHVSVKAVYRLEPLPAGTQRTSLVEILRSFGWNAKPLQPCKGSQGQAWQVGAESEPPKPFIESQQGWIGISKVKDATPVAKPQGLIATMRTKKHIQEASASSSSGTADPWQTGPDPWGGYAKTTKAAAVPTQHVQSRLEDVESRLHEHVKQTVTQEVHQLPQHPATDLRLTAVESQIQSLVENQTKLEHWVQDGSSKIHGLQQECGQLQMTVLSQGQTLQQVAHEVSQCTSSLQNVSTEVSGLKTDLGKHLGSYFTKQQEAIEAMLAKKARHS